MAVNFFLQNPVDYSSHFDYDYEVNEWIPAAGFSGTCNRYEADSDHPSCLCIDPDASQDGKGVRRDIPNAHASVVYVLEFSYKCASGQEIDLEVYDVTNSASVTTDTLTSTTWANFRTTFTCPAGCATLRIHLKAGTDSTAVFYVDDIYCQSNALPYDPVTSINFPKDGTDHQMLSGGDRSDHILSGAQVAMQFEKLQPSQFDRLLDVYKANTDTWYDDSDVPAMIERGTLYTETTYNFSGISNPSVTHIGYAEASGSEPSAKTDFQTTEIDTADYEAMDGDDSNVMTDTASTTSHYVYHKFLFDVSGEYGSAGQIRNFSIEYKGSANDQSSANEDGVALYLWNVNGENWVKIAQSRTSDKETLSFSTTKPEIAQLFVDTSDGYIRVLVQSQAAKGDSALSMSSYWIQAIINEDTGNSINLANKALPDSDGEVIYVKNLSSRGELSLYGSQAEWVTAYWSQSGLSSFDGSKVNDGNVAAACFETDSSAAGSYLLLDCGEDNDQDFISLDITIITGNTYATWNVQYSHDGSAWTAAYTGAGGAPVAAGTHSYSWDSVGAYRYWRLYKTDAAVAGEAHAEIQFNAPTYKLGDDRESIASITGCASGDMIEVKYNQQYLVSVRGFQENRLGSADPSAPRRTLTMTLKALVALKG